VFAGGGDRERALGAGMAFDLVEIRFGRTAVRHLARFDARQRILAIERIDDGRQAGRREQVRARYQTPFDGIRRRHDQPTAGSERRERRRHDAGDGADLSAERQLTEKFDLFQLPRLVHPRLDDAERDRKIEPAALLRNVGRTEMGRDAAGRHPETGIQQCGANPVAALANGRRRQAGDREGRQAAGQVNLDADFVGIEAGLAPADQPGQRHR
jgi:hypothetical protein